jgi:hypothetical protein
VWTTDGLSLDDLERRSCIANPIGNPRRQNARLLAIRQAAVKRTIVASAHRPYVGCQECLQTAFGVALKIGNDLDRSRVNRAAARASAFARDPRSRAPPRCLAGSRRLRLRSD